MNLRLVKTSKTLLPFKGMFGMPLPEWDGREVSPKSPRQSDRGGGPPGSKGVNVLIASEDPFVTDFLRGLVAIHGYEAEVVTDFDEASMKVRRGFVQVVFIDDACFEMENFKSFQQKSQKLIQGGVPVILLTDEHTKQQVRQLSKIKFFGIVRKPVGYLQLGQVLADLVPG